MNMAEFKILFIVTTISIGFFSIGHAQLYQDEIFETQLNNWQPSRVKNRQETSAGIGASPYEKSHDSSPSFRSRSAQASVLRDSLVDKRIRQRNTLTAGESEEVTNQPVRRNNENANFLFNRQKNNFEALESKLNNESEERRRSDWERFEDGEPSRADGTFATRRTEPSRHQSAGYRGGVRRRSGTAGDLAIGSNDPVDKPRRFENVGRGKTTFRGRTHFTERPSANFESDTGIQNTLKPRYKKVQATDSSIYETNTVHSEFTFPSRQAVQRLLHSNDASAGDSIRAPPSLTERKDDSTAQISRSLLNPNQKLSTRGYSNPEYQGGFRQANESRVNANGPPVNSAQDLVSPSDSDSGDSDSSFLMAKENDGSPVLAQQESTSTVLQQESDEARVGENVSAETAISDESQKSIPILYQNQVSLVDHGDGRAGDRSIQAPTVKPESPEKRRNRAEEFTKQQFTSRQGLRRLDTNTMERIPQLVPVEFSRSSNKFGRETNSKDAVESQNGKGVDGENDGRIRIHSSRQRPRMQASSDSVVASTSSNRPPRTQARSRTDTQDASSRSAFFSGKSTISQEKENRRETSPASEVNRDTSVTNEKLPNQSETFSNKRGEEEKIDETANYPREFLEKLKSSQSNVSPYENRRDKNVIKAEESFGHYKSNDSFLRSKRKQIQATESSLAVPKNESENVESITANTRKRGEANESKVRYSQAFYRRLAGRADNKSSGDEKLADETRTEAKTSGVRTSKYLNGKKQATINVATATPISGNYSSTIAPEAFSQPTEGRRKFQPKNKISLEERKLRIALLKEKVQKNATEEQSKARATTELFNTQANTHPHHSRYNGRASAGDSLSEKVSATPVAADGQRNRWRRIPGAGDSDHEGKLLMETREREQILLASEEEQRKYDVDGPGSAALTTAFPSTTHRPIVRLQRTPATTSKPNAVTSEKDFGVQDSTVLPSTRHRFSARINSSTVASLFPEAEHVTLPSLASLFPATTSSPETTDILSIENLFSSSLNASDSTTQLSSDSLLPVSSTISLQSTTSSSFTRNISPPTATRKPTKKRKSSKKKNSKSSSRRANNSPRSGSSKKKTKNKATSTTVRTSSATSLGSDDSNGVQAPSLASADIESIINETIGVVHSNPMSSPRPAHIPRSELVALTPETLFNNNRSIEGTTSRTETTFPTSTATNTSNINGIDNSTNQIENPSLISSSECTGNKCANATSQSVEFLANPTANNDNNNNDNNNNNKSADRQATTKTPEALRKIFIFGVFPNNTVQKRPFTKSEESTRGRAQANGSPSGKVAYSAGDYDVFGVYPNNSVVRRRGWKTFDHEKYQSPYLIFGIYPNNTIIKKFPNGTTINDTFMVSDNEIEKGRGGCACTTASSGTPTIETATRGSTDRSRGDESMTTRITGATEKTNVGSGEDDGRATAVPDDDAENIDFNTILGENNSRYNVNDDVNSTTNVDSLENSTEENEEEEEEGEEDDDEEDEEDEGNDDEESEGKKGDEVEDKTNVEKEENEGNLEERGTRTPIATESITLSSNFNEVDADKQQLEIAEVTDDASTPANIVESSTASTLQNFSEATHEKETGTTSVVIVEGLNTINDAKSNDVESREKADTSNERTNLVKAPETLADFEISNEVLRSLFGGSEAITEGARENTEATERSELGKSLFGKLFEGLKRAEESGPTTASSASNSEGENFTINLGFGLDDYNVPTEDNSGKDQKETGAGHERHETTEASASTSASRNDEVEIKESAGPPETAESSTRKHFGQGIVSIMPDEDDFLGRDRHLYGLLSGSAVLNNIEATTANPEDSSTRRGETTAFVEADVPGAGLLIGRSTADAFDYGNAGPTVQGSSFSTTEGYRSEPTTSLDLLTAFLPTSLNYEQVLPNGFTIKKKRRKPNNQLEESSGLTNLAFRALSSSKENAVPQLMTRVKTTVQTPTSTAAAIEREKIKSLSRTSVKAYINLTTLTSTPMTEQVFIVTPVPKTKVSPDYGKDESESLVTRVPGYVVTTTDQQNENDILTMSSQHVQKVTKAPANIPDNFLSTVFGDIEEKASSPIPDILKNVGNELPGDGLSVSVAKRIISLALEKAGTSTTPFSTQSTVLTTSLPDTNDDENVTPASTIPIAYTQPISTTTSKKITTTTTKKSVKKPQATAKKTVATTENSVTGKSSSKTTTATPPTTISMFTTTAQPFITSLPLTTVAEQVLVTPKRIQQRPESPPKTISNEKLVTFAASPGIEGFNGSAQDIDPLNALFSANKYVPTKTPSSQKVTEDLNALLSGLWQEKSVKAAKSSSTTDKPKAKGAKDEKPTSLSEKASASLSASDLKLLESILSQRGGNQGAQDLEQIVKNQIRLAEAVRKASRNLKKKQRSTTTTPKPAVPRGLGFLLNLFGGKTSNLETRSPKKPRTNETAEPFTSLSNPLDPANESPEESNPAERTARGELVSAAIDVTKAVSRFMGTVLSNAAQSFQNFFQSFRS